jgi:hypothetical protein
MKSLLNLAIIFGFFINVNAQIAKTSFNVKEENMFIKSVQLNQKLMVFNGMDFEIVPQFGGLFSKVFKEVISKIDLKNYFKDFDFGFNLQVKYDFVKNLNFTVLYNVGMLKFDQLNSAIVAGPVMKFRVEYWF